MTNKHIVIQMSFLLLLLVFLKNNFTCVLDYSKGNLNVKTKRNRGDEHVQLNMLQYIKKKLRYQLILISLYIHIHYF